MTAGPGSNCLRRNIPEGHTREAFSCVRQICRPSQVLMAAIFLGDGGGGQVILPRDRVRDLFAHSRTSLKAVQRKGEQQQLLA